MPWAHGATNVTVEVRGCGRISDYLVPEPSDAQHEHDAHELREELTRLRHEVTTPECGGRLPRWQRAAQEVESGGEGRLRFPEAEDQRRVLRKDRQLNTPEPLSFLEPGRAVAANAAIARSIALMMSPSLSLTS